MWTACLHWIGVLLEAVASTMARVMARTAIPAVRAAIVAALRVSPEAMRVHAVMDTACVHTDVVPGRVLLGMSLIAGTAIPFSGLFARGDRMLWIHGRTDDCVELMVESSFSEPGDLRQVAYHVGTQLGRAHPKEGPGRAAAPGLRTLLLESTRANESRIRRAIEELMEAPVEAWTAVRGETRQRGGPVRRGANDAGP